jgi:sarcosine oxidase gamma subunit
MNPNDTRRSAVEGLISGVSNAVNAATLCALGDHRKVGIKGPGALEWLRGQGIDVPAGVYDVSRGAAGSLVARVGNDEIIIESTSPDGLVDTVDDALNARTSGVYRVDQETTTLLLSGSVANAVWRQACGVDVMHEPPYRILYTRVAGISCGVIPEGTDSDRAYRIWVDYSYAPELWSTLMEIAGDLS